MAGSSNCVRLYKRAGRGVAHFPGKRYIYTVTYTVTESIMVYLLDWLSFCLIQLWSYPFPSFWRLSCNWNDRIQIIDNVCWQWLPSWLGKKKRKHSLQSRKLLMLSNTELRRQLWLVTKYTIKSFMKLTKSCSTKNKKFSVQ